MCLLLFTTAITTYILKKAAGTNEKNVTGFGCSGLTFLCLPWKYGVYRNGAFRDQSLIQESLHKPEDEAYELISLAWKRYDSAQAYMNIVLRENRCDAINECFIELFEAPDNENCKNRLMHQLESALTAEKLRLGSVF